MHHEWKADINIKTIDVPILSGRYRVFDRTVHLNYLKEQLQGKGVNFDTSRLAAPPEVSVEVEADTVYIQVRTTENNNNSQSASC